MLNRVTWPSRLDFKMHFIRYWSRRGLKSKRKFMCQHEKFTHSLPHSQISNFDIHYSTGHYCEHCDRPFVSHLGLIQHKKTCSEKDNPFYYCDTCHRPFFGIAGLNQHKKKFCHMRNDVSRERTTTNVITNNKDSNDSYVGNKHLNESDGQNTVPYLSTSNEDLKNGDFKDETVREKEDCNGNTVKGSRSSSAVSQPQVHKCERCNKVFKYNGTLTRHIKLSVKENSVRNCEKCDKKFCLRKDFRKHEIFHVSERKDGDFTCHKCGKKLTSQRMLSSHLEHAEMQSTVIECDICNKQFCLPKDLQRHKLWHDKPSVYKCDVCSKELKSIGRLNEHVKSHGEATLECNICSKLFTKEMNLKRHLETHTEERNHRCHVCEKSFKTKCVLRGHLKSHGIKVVPHECNLCGKVFITKFKLKSHQVCVHKLEGKYQCSVCGKGLPTYSLYERHLRSHTGEKTLICDICGKSFKDRSHWNEHKRGVHGVDVRFWCKYCGKGFYGKSRLEKHTRFHLGIKPFKCDQCGKSFGLKNGLDRHMIYHTGEFPFKCEICKKQFREMGNYKQHLRVHSGEKPYECSVCRRRFINSSNRNKHMKVHRKENKE